MLKHLCEKKESRDSVDGGGYGDGISTVLGEGKNLVVRKWALAYYCRSTKMDQG